MKLLVTAPTSEDGVNAPFKMSTPPPSSNRFDVV